MMKLTILYGHPDDPEEFERYYAETHLPLSSKIGGVSRVETTRFGPGPDGSKPDYYRMAEVYFANEEDMGSALGSSEGQATVDDIPNFATGGVTVLTGTVEG